MRFGVPYVGSSIGQAMIATPQLPNPQVWDPNHGDELACAQWFHHLAQPWRQGERMDKAGTPQKDRIA